MSATNQNNSAHAKMRDVKMPGSKMPEPRSPSAKIPSAEMPNPTRPSTHAQYSGVSKAETSKPKMPPPKLPSQQNSSLPEPAPKMPGSKRMTLPGTSAHMGNLMPEGEGATSKAVPLPCMPEGRVKDGKTSSPQISETKAKAKTKVLPTDTSTEHPSVPSKRIEQVAISELKPWSRNARTHSRKQIRQIANSIEEFGFTNPVLIDQDMSILAGHGRVEAAKVLGWTQVPCLRLDDMTTAQKRAYVLADNKLALNAGWDEDILSEELLSLSEIDLGFDLSITGFSIAEVDDLIDINAPEEDQNPRDEQIPEAVPSRVKSGDVWALGPHRLICGNSLDAQTIDRLMMRYDPSQVQPDLDLSAELQYAGDLLTLKEEASGLRLGVNADAATADIREFEKAQMVFTDPPYNVPINGHVGGNGKTVHREFAMASGEMTSEAFTDFLKITFENLSRHAEDGSIHFICMDWRHVKEVMAAGDQVYNELKNLIVWSKDRGGMGTFYRSRHELIFAYKCGTAAHINSFELGQHGRYRTNVWEYPAASRDDLSMHPTVKPVQMICDAIRDVSSRGGIVLDLFGGSGSTLIAAHKTGRRARVCEIDPLYCDVILARYEAHAKDEAILLQRGGDFTNHDEDELEAA